MNSWRREFDRIGGRYALSTPVILTAFAAFLLSTVSFDVFVGGSHAPASVAIGTLSACLGVVFALAARRWLPVRERPSRPWLAIATFTATGVVRVLFTGALTSLAGMVLVPSALHRLLPMAVQGAFVMSALTIIVDRGVEHRGLFALLLAERHRLLQMRASFEESLAQARADLEGEVHAVLDPTIAQIRELLRGLDESGDASLGAASDLLSSAVAGVVRPLSHALIAPREEASSSGLALEANPEQRSALPRAVDVPDCIRPGWVAGLVLGLIASTVPILGRDYSTFLLAILLAGGIWATLTMARRWWPRRLRVLPLEVALAVLLAVYSLTSGALFWVLSLVSTAAEWTFTGYLELSVSRTVIVGMVVSIVFIVDRRRLDDEAELALVNAELAVIIARQRTELWNARRKLSYVLHGPVQSSLVSAAVSLAQPGVNRRQIERLRASIDEAVASIDRVDAQSASIGLALAQIVSLWDFACRIEVSVSPETVRLLDGDAAMATAVGEIVREGVSNAVRHGHATTIVVDIRPLDGGLLRVRVDDDGVGLAEDMVPGLGSRMLDEAAYQWTRDPRDPGTRLEAVLALA